MKKTLEEFLNEPIKPFVLTPEIWAQATSKEAFDKEVENEY